MNPVKQTRLARESWTPSYFSPCRCSCLFDGSDDPLSNLAERMAQTIPSERFPQLKITGRWML